MTRNKFRLSPTLSLNAIAELSKQFVAVLLNRQYGLLHNITLLTSNGSGLTIGSEMFDIPNSGQTEVGVLYFAEPNALPTEERIAFPEGFISSGFKEVLVTNEPWLSAYGYEAESGVTLSFTNGSKLEAVSAVAPTMITLKAPFIDMPFTPECEVYRREHFYL